MYVVAFEADLGVAPRHVRVRHLDVAVLRAPEHDRRLDDLVPLAREREGDGSVGTGAAPSGCRILVAAATEAA